MDFESAKVVALTTGAFSIDAYTSKSGACGRGTENIRKFTRILSFSFV